jgi:hypothetical protein
MNRLMQEYYPTFEMYQALRSQLMEIVKDEDLMYTPGGANPTLGTLCREIGETEHAYIQSFKTFNLDFSYHNQASGLTESVTALRVWYAELDRELKQTFGQLSDEDLANRAVDRGGDFKIPPQIQLEIYKEALLIFYGKVSVYLKALGKTLPEQWHDWIA